MPLSKNRTGTTYVGAGGTRKKKHKAKTNEQAERCTQHKTEQSRAGTPYLNACSGSGIDRSVSSGGGGTLR